MRAFYFLLLFFAIGIFVPSAIFSFNYKYYDPENLVSKPFLPTLKQIEDPSFDRKIIKILSEQIKNNPNNLDLHRIRLDYTYFLWEVSPKKDVPQIIKFGNKAVDELCKYFPNHPHCPLTRAIMLSLLGLELGPLNTLKGVPEVIKLYKKAAAENPRWFYCFAVRNLGRLYFKLPPFPVSVGSMVKAQKYLFKAYKMCPDHPDIYVYLGDLMYELGQKEKAIKFVKKLYTLKPKTWNEKIILTWTLRTVPVILKKYETGTYDKYNWDYLLDPSRHPEKFKKQR